MPTPSVLVDMRADGIAVVTLNRPGHLNALTPAMMLLLRDTFTSLDANANCRVIVLTGAGRAFSAGFDMKETPLHDNAVAAMAAQELFGGTPGVIRRTRQPVIAAIPGATVGAGFALALAADIRIAAKSARFLNGAVKIGLSAGESGMSYHLPRLIGAGRAFEIMLSGRAVGADEAFAIGLVTQLVEPEALMDAALTLAVTITAHSPFAMTKTKQLMWQNLEAPNLDAAVELENHVQTVAMLSADFREGVQAFIEKRPPQFQGR